MEERDLVEIHVAVIPRGALGAGHTFGGFGQEVHHVHPGGLHEQVHRRRQVHAVGGHDVVVVDVEREREVVAPPSFDVEGMVPVVQRRRVHTVDGGVPQPDFVLAVDVRSVAVLAGARLG